MFYASCMHNSSAAAVELREPKAAGRAKRRVVLKFGTRLLTGNTTTLDPARMAAVARAVVAEPKTKY
jgi:hypothetical protein